MGEARVGAQGCSRGSCGYPAGNARMLGAVTMCACGAPWSQLGQAATLSPSCSVPCATVKPSEGPQCPGGAVQVVLCLRAWAVRAVGWE